MTVTENDVTGLLTAGERSSPDELRRLLDYLLVGKPYLFGRQTYGDELTFHFGKLQPYTHPKLAGKSRGTHVLTTRGSAWRLTSAGRRSVVSYGWQHPVSAGQPLNAAALESGGFVTAGAYVLSAEVVEYTADHPRRVADGYGLELALSDGSSLLVLPLPADRVPVDGVADWQLLTPAGFLETGPGPAWRFEPAAT